MSADRHLPVALPPAARTLPTMLRLHAGRLGDKALFRADAACWTYAGIADVAARMAGRLELEGIRKGDRVAILSNNRAEVMQVLLGCGWLGAIAVPINAASKAPQIRYILEHSGARLLIAEASLLRAVDARALAGLALRSVWSFDEPASDLHLPMAQFHGAGPPIAAGDIAPTDIFAILYTSGTTGAPKGVLCPHAQFYWWGAYTSAFLEITEQDVLTTSLPLFHTNAINTFFQALLTGATHFVLPRFSVSDFWPAMQRSGATVTYLLGATVPMLLSRQPSPDERQHGLRVALAPGVPENLHAAFLARTGVRFVDGFGSTETNFVIGSTAAARVPGRMGRAADGIRLRVVDADGAAVAAGEPGELLIKADDPQAVSAGYFADEKKTAEAWRDGWFHSGDRVILHDDGTLSFLDRLKDSIRRRGENISSFEVEQAIACHPAVAACAVFPVPSPLAEDEVMAAIVLKAGSSATPPEIASHCTDLLPRFAVPRYIDIVADLPRTENGKVQKFALRDRGVTATTWDREA